MGVLLKLPQADEREAEALKTALSPDDWSDGCSTISTSSSGAFIVVEASCSCHSKVAKIRSFVDDVLRLVDALAHTNEKLK
ncbi:MAG: hypothetical protein QXW23_03915 [Thermofilaceae archaeon]